MTSWQIALAGGGLVVLSGIWAAQKSKHPFDIRDVLMDPTTNKASLNNCTLALFALLSMWLVVDRELRDLPGVDTILLGVLGIFVVGRGATQAVNAFKAGQPGPTTITETIERTASVPPDRPIAPEVPKTARVRAAP